MIPWDSNKTNPLYLFTKEEFDSLPDGFSLECIDGTIKVKGKDPIDKDTRFGYIAYGVRDLLNHPEKNLLLTFILKTN